MSKDAENRLHIQLFDTEEATSPQRYCFAPDKNVEIGRHSSNDIVIEHPRVSRFHAVVSFDGKDWRCRALAANKLRCKLQLLREVKVSEGTIVELAGGAPQLQFHLSEDHIASNPGPGSITNLIRKVKRGSVESFRELWTRLFTSVARIADKMLGTHPRRVSDEEDIAGGVLTNFHNAAVTGQLPDLDDRQSLWRLLTTMTRNAASNRIRDENREKRGGGRVRGDSIGEFTPVDPESGGSAFDRFVSHEPTPGLVVSVNEQTQQWLALLPDDEHRRVVLMKMEEFTNEEIAEELDLSLRTIERRLKTIRDLWSDLSID